jgi:two-component system phosphate regulon sensor histidine kinase PhoR
VTKLRTVAGSFRARLIVGYVLIAAVFALAWGWSLYTPLTQAALQQQTRTLTAVAHAGALVSAESSAPPRALASQIVSGTDLRLTIVATDGHVLADSTTDPSTMENHGTRPEIIAALAGHIGTDLRVSKTLGLEELYVAVPAVVDGRRVALRVAQPFTQIEAVAVRSRRIGLALLVAALITAVAIAAWASAAASRPVAELSEAARRMAAGNLDIEVPEVPSDLEVLAEALVTLREQMRSRIDALVAEQRTLRTTLDGLHDAVFLLEDETVRYANNAASTLFRTPTHGWRRVELENSGLPESVLGAIRAALAGAEPQAIELDPDPRGRVMRLLVVPLEELGTKRAIAVVSDITQRARLDRVRRDFVANASHELKTPVAGIQLLAESAETAASDGDVEMALIFTRQIEAEAARLKRLVMDLLDLSRLDAVPEAGTITDVRLAIDNVIVGHRTAAARKSLKLESDLSAVRGIDVYAAADPTDVAIALDNLVDNALAYTEEGSVRVRVKANDAFVTIRVADTGPGIDHDHLPRIFERFYRVDRARSRDSGGTGLGLALVKHVVERSGGTVSVESNVGVGTTFTIRLPRAV